VGGGVGWLVMMKRKEGTKAHLFFIADNLSGNFVIFCFHCHGWPVVFHEQCLIPHRAEKREGTVHC